MLGLFEGRRADQTHIVRRLSLHPAARMAVGGCLRGRRRGTGREPGQGRETRFSRQDQRSISAWRGRSPPSSSSSPSPFMAAHSLCSIIRGPGSSLIDSTREGGNLSSQCGCFLISHVTVAVVVVAAAELRRQLLLGVSNLEPLNQVEKRGWTLKAAQSPDLPFHVHLQQRALFSSRSARCLSSFSSINRVKRTVSPHEQPLSLAERHGPEKVDGS